MIRQFLSMTLVVAFASPAIATSETPVAEQAAPPLVEIDPAHPTAEWQAILSGLAAVRRVESGFFENRYHRIRRKPFTSPGTMRYEPGVGVSIARTTDTGEEVVLIKADGIYRREAGKFDKIPYDVPATRAPRLLMSVVGWDAARVARDFSVKGRLVDNLWRMELRPRDPEMARIVSRLIVEGSGDRLTQITLLDDDFIRLEIFIHSAAFPKEFPVETQKAYFGR